MHEFSKQPLFPIASCGLVHLHLYLSLVQAEYWHDPFNLDKYRKSCVFLPDINQENVRVVSMILNPAYTFVCLLLLQTFNQDYKDRLSNISNLVLVKFLEDTMVQPRESEVSGMGGRMRRSGRAGSRS